MFVLKQFSYYKRILYAVGLAGWRAVLKFPLLETTLRPDLQHPSSAQMLWTVTIKLNHKGQSVTWFRYTFQIIYFIFF